MKLNVERWMENTKPFDDLVYELFRESINNYKIGSYKSAFIMSYLSFKLTIRNRIINCSYGKELKKKNPNFWEFDILSKLQNDDKWEEQVNTIVLASCAPLKDRKDIGILNFKYSELAKTEYTYWKEKRNACVHGKNQIIDSSTVEGFWNYLINNLNQFYVLGGEEYLIRELIDTYKYYKHPNISNKDRVTELLYDIGTIFQDHTENCFNIFLDGINETHDFINDENKDFWSAVIHFPQENVVNGFVQCISCRSKMFFELYAFFPELLEMLVAIQSKFIVDILSKWLKDFSTYNVDNNEIFWRILVDSLSKYGSQVDLTPIINNDTFGLIQYFSGKDSDVEILNRYDVFKKYLFGVANWYFETNAGSQYINFLKNYNEFSNIEICFSYLKWDSECLLKLENALDTFKESFPSRENPNSIRNGRAFIDSCQKIIQMNQAKIIEAANDDGSSYENINQIIKGTYLE